MPTFTDQLAPTPQDAAIVTADDGRARFILLSDALVRMEYAEDGQFEDRASLTVINRSGVTPKFTAEHDGKGVVIDTGRITLTYNGGPFDAQSLHATFRLNERGETGQWNPGDSPRANLRGTTRTLDGVSGACELELGLLSRDGWAVFDDTDRPLLESREDADEPWAVARPERDGRYQDWYLLAHGRDYAGAIRDYTRIAGRIPTPPRYALGLWWSRYWPYTDDELKSLVAEFREHDVPLDVLVIDMDWHLDGWTGYTWNPRCFPEPDAFLDWCDNENLRVTLNLHPADGVGKHEWCFHEMAHHLGHDTSWVYRIPFDCTDPRFMNAYFKFLHHPMEQQGIDFWWMDWQQGDETDIEELDPLFWLNHLHWTDMERNPARNGARPLVFSRWGGLGNHRYQIGFSGDTYCNWESLAFQPRFTARAGNVGYAYWSHDIGGHQPGPVEPELFVRWMQFGAFSPILRTHCGRHPDAERRLWAFPAPYSDAAKEAVRLRYDLAPYIYGAMLNTARTGVPFCRPLYFDCPESEDAYACADQYAFGDALLVAPVITPADETSGLAPVTAWLPPGTWINWFTGEVAKGPRRIHRLTDLDEIPLWIRADRAIIPADLGATSAAAALHDALDLLVWPHAALDGQTVAGELREDDGVSFEDDETPAVTDFTLQRDGNILRLTIAPARGMTANLPSVRTWRIHIRDAWPVTRITDTRAGDDAAATINPDAMTTTFEARVPTAEGATFELHINPEANHAHTDNLRGRVRRIRALRTRLGAGAVPAIDALAQRADALTPDNAAAIHDNYPALIDAVAESGVDDARRQQALAQLLHLCCDMTIDASAEREIAARAMLHMTPLGHDIAAALDLTVTPRPDRSHTVTCEDAGAPALTAALDVPLPDAPERIDAVARVRIGLGDTETDVEYHHSALRSINNWAIIGPFDEPRRRMLETDFDVEREAGAINLEATHVGRGGKDLAWRPVARTVHAGDDLMTDFRVDFHDVFGEHIEDASAYAVAWIDSTEDRDAVLALGSDDGYVLWINGEEIRRKPVIRSYSAGQDRIPIRLARGRNEILLRIAQAGGDWCFSARIQDRWGKPIN